MVKISLVFEVAQNAIFFCGFWGLMVWKKIFHQAPKPSRFKEDEPGAPPKSTKNGGWKTGTMTSTRGKLHNLRCPSIIRGAFLSPPS